MTTTMSSKRSDHQHLVHLQPPPLQTFKGMNSMDKQQAQQQQLTYQQKKRLKLAKFRSKFDNPIGYESNSMNKTQSRSNPSTTRTMYSTSPSTRSYSSQRSKSSVPSSSTMTMNSSLLSRWACEPIERSNSVRSVKKEWDNRFPFSNPNEYVRSPCNDKKSPLGFSSNFFEKEEEYWKSADMLDELDLGDFPVFNFKPLSSSMRSRQQVEMPIDWFSFDIDSLTDEYGELNDYKSARNYLYHLWAKMSIPKIYQQEFEKEHCQKDTVTNRTFIFSEIATMESLRDKIRIALIWLDGKTELDIEENASLWCQIADSFRNEYEYMYKSKKFIYNGKDMFSIEAPNEQITYPSESPIPNKEA
ncbi:predicted protein [Naegleria gruberi]|uniref:Predicted protein n=1 Tax=Naegleria gruberi TaxID=5762 RepID=D2VTL2_NAEGR|nr:uncharacterized protein NAEGRDRAFT_52141 [Naegleria gruberi]EFC39951.1 predicted protein [Naegleria gruberi]|eukprot:XP_002672695.1 predicted protein [Naegleria gruberi strain NEG-M]